MRFNSDDVRSNDDLFLCILRSFWWRISSWRPLYLFFFFPERREYFPNPCLSLPPITGANVILSIKSLTVLFSFLLKLCIHLYIYIYPFINVQWGRFKLKSYILKYALFALFAAFFSSKMLPLFIWLQGSLYLIHFTLIYCCYLAQITMQYAWGPGDIYIYIYI